MEYTFNREAPVEWRLAGVPKVPCFYIFTETGIWFRQLK